MRDILFRGKAINRDKGYHRTEYKNGDWVYGLLIKLYDERWENLPAEMVDTDGVRGIEIDYKTIGQYTGLTDKNGQKIFEGDIVKHYNKISIGEPDYYTISLIEWNEEECKHKQRKKDGCCYNVSKRCVFEVIGNIHDNPELLGGKE